jgi:hypothetical protein
MSGAYVLIAIIAACIRIALLVRRGQKAGLTRQAPRMAPAPDDPRWQGTRGEQLCGRACADCNEKIVLESDGKTCATCLAPLHKKACAKHHRRTAHAPEPTAPYR